MGDSRIKDISSLLSAFFDENKLRRGERYTEFFSSWSDTVGERLAVHSRIVDVDKGLLVVEAEHPGWIQLLQMRQSSILESVARRFPELKLRGIVFRIAGQSSISRARDAEVGMDTQEKANPPPDSAAERDEQLEAPVRDAGTDDPEFLKLFESLKQTMRGKI
jgi:hypothetical protein